jgi:hypothetical protein
MDSTIVKDVAHGFDLVVTAYWAVTALVAFVLGRVHALRKKK